MAAGSHKNDQALGREFEKHVAKMLGSEVVRGSGNQWHSKMDVADGSILWSCKHTGKRTFSLTPELLNEVRTAVRGIGGKGGDIKPAMAIDVDGEAFAVIGLDDLLSLLTAEGSAYIKPKRSQVQRRRAATPQLLRDDV